MGLWDAVKSAAKTVGTGIVDMATGQALIDMLAPLPAEQVLRELQTKIPAMKDGEYNAFHVALILGNRQPKGPT